MLMVLLLLNCRDWGDALAGFRYQIARDMLLTMQVSDIHSFIVGMLYCKYFFFDLVSVTKKGLVISIIITCC